MSQYDHKPECRVVLITHGTSWWCLDCDTGVADLRAKPAEEHDVFLRYEQERNHYREKYHEERDATLRAETALKEISECLDKGGTVDDLKEILSHYEKRKTK